MAEQITYGGQAVIEGVMMRGVRYFAVACRKADGEILVRQEEVPAFFTRYAWAKWPFFRGVFALADAMVLGMKSLLFSAEVAVQEEEKKRQSPPPDPFTQALLGPLHLLLATGGGPPGSITSIAITGSAIIGMVFGIGLFMLLPTLIAGWAKPWLGGTLWQPVLEGVLRVGIVLGYIALIGTRKEVQRLFQYHGAEHQAINAWENDGVVSVDAALLASRIHPRCGTNFVLTVMMVKALIFTIIPFHNSVLIRMGLRLLMLPVVASLSYEVIRLAGKYRRVALLQWLVLPGRLTQYLTTREPKLEMVEVAVASLRGVMEREGTLPPERQDREEADSDAAPAFA